MSTARHDSKIGLGQTEAQAVLCLGMVGSLSREPSTARICSGLIGMTNGAGDRGA
jgi:hypothetical protein